MALLTKDKFLGANDLEEQEVELPSIGGSVKIRALPSAASSEASSQALEMVTGRRGEQTARVNTAKLEELQVYHALVEPKLENVKEARKFLENCGPAARTLIEAIDNASGVDKEALEDANSRFRPGVEGAGDGGEASTNGADAPDGS